MLKVGTCGWSSFPAKQVLGDWRKKYKSKLQAYATVFPAVEINSTFYKLPLKKTASRWREEADEANPEFEFTVKASRIITHEDRFRTDKSISFFNKTAEIARLVRARLLLLQTPASFKPSSENAGTLERFLRKIEWEGRIVWEPRGAWLSEGLSEVKRICAEHDLIHCVDPFRARSVTSGEVYYRLHGLGKKNMYYYKFSDDELKNLAKKTEERAGHVFFNNVWMGEDALRFLKLVK